MNGQPEHELCTLDYQEPLGNTTVKVSARRERIENHDKKWWLARKVKQLLSGTGYRVLNCQKAIRTQVEVQKSADGEASRIDGVMLCGSVWLCPVCAQRIAYERSLMLKQANQAGYKMVLVTATLQHSRTDSLKELLKALKSALKALKSGRWWQGFREKYGVVAYVSSFEITYGVNGWHPHCHMLFYLSGEVDAEEFGSAFRERYVELIEREGSYASYYHSVDVRKADSDASSYLTKWSLSEELTGSFAKSGAGKTFWQLVEDGRAELVREYAEATFGLKALTFSQGAKKLLGIENFSIEQPQEWVTVAEVSVEAWRVVCDKALQGVCLELALYPDDGEALQMFIESLVALIDDS